jgi:O-antigen/teichoic acid export membrane protein
VSFFRDRREHLLPLAAVQIVGLVCGVVSVRWTTRIIPPDVLGLYGLLLSAVQAGLVVTHQGFVKQVQGMWTPTTPAKSLLPVLRATLPTPTLWLAVGLLVVWLTLHVTGSVPLHGAIYGWLLIANLGVAAAQVLQTALQAEQRYWANFAVSAVGSILRSFGPPLLALTLGASLAVVSSAFLIHVFAVIALAGWFLRSSWQRSGNTIAVDSAGKTRLLVQAFAGIGLASWLASVAPRWFAGLTLSPDEVGFFVLASNLSLIIPASVGAIALSYTFPVVFASDATRTPERVTSATLVTVMLLSQAGIVVLWLIAPYLVGVLIDARYAPALDWILATGGATLAATTGQFVHNLLLARNRGTDCLKLSVLSCAFRLVAMAIACGIGPKEFRITLVLLPWLTVGLEWGYARHRLRAKMAA